MKTNIPINIGKRQTNSVTNRTTKLEPQQPLKAIHEHIEQQTHTEGEQLHQICSNKSISNSFNEGEPEAEQRCVEADVSVRIEYERSFSQRYLRNHKRGGMKNLRCFPTCSADQHFSKGFCGRSVFVHVDFGSEDDCMHNVSLDDFVICSEFSLFYDDEQLSTENLANSTDLLKEVRCGTEMTRTDILERQKGRSNPQGAWYAGTIVKPTIFELLQQQKPTFNLAVGDNGLPTSGFLYELNKSPTGWHYSWKATKTTCDALHCMKTYVFKRLDSSCISSTLDNFLCIGIQKSPPFMIYCRRRKNFKDLPSIFSQSFSTVATTLSFGHSVKSSPSYKLDDTDKENLEVITPESNKETPVVGKKSRIKAIKSSVAKRVSKMARLPSFSPNLNGLLSSTFGKIINGKKRKNLEDEKRLDTLELKTEFGDETNELVLMNLNVNVSDKITPKLRHETVSNMETGYGFEFNSSELLEPFHLSDNKVKDDLHLPRNNSNTFYADKSIKSPTAGSRLKKFKTSPTTPSFNNSTAEKVETNFNSLFVPNDDFHTFNSPAFDWLGSRESFMWDEEFLKDLAGDSIWGNKNMNNFNDFTFKTELPQKLDFESIKRDSERLFPYEEDEKEMDNGLRLF